MLSNIHIHGCFSIMNLLIKKTMSTMNVDKIYNVNACDNFYAHTLLAKLSRGTAFFNVFLICINI